MSRIFDSLENWEFRRDEWNYRERRYRIEPRFANLEIMPLDMRGLFPFKDAHLICAEWNCWHEAEDMVIEVEVLEEDQPQ